MIEEKKLSIVVPLYGSGVNVPHTVPQLLEVAEGLKADSIICEFVFVDDAYPDGAAEQIRKYCDLDSRFILVRMSKNVGSMLAIRAGARVATGDCMIMITADLQDPPELMPDMLKLWRGGAEVVMATREGREDRGASSLFARLYNKLMRKFVLPGYPSDGFDYFLLDRKVIDALNTIKEKNASVMNLVYWMGFKRASIPYTRRKRTHGKSRWTFSKKIKLLTDSLISFSYLPMRIMSALGFVIATLSFIYGLIVVVSYFSGNILVVGFSALAILFAFLQGVTILMLGVMGEYLWRALDEARDRPGYFISEIYRSPKK